MAQEVGRYTITAALAYAAYITFTCPCSSVLSCHLDKFFAALALAIVVAVFVNQSWMDPFG